MNIRIIERRINKYRRRGLQPIRLPGFGLANSIPELSLAIYRERANAAQPHANLGFLTHSILSAITDF
jgi:hypothetical protein